MMQGEYDFYNRWFGNMVKLNELDRKLSEPVWPYVVFGLMPIIIVTVLVILFYFTK